MSYGKSYFNRLILVLVAALTFIGGAFGQVTPPSGIVTSDFTTAS
ncbi:hypothetical protein BH10ACI1_BH10ACI1_24650 [soil metagenome]